MTQETGSTRPPPAELQNSPLTAAGSLPDDEAHRADPDAEPLFIEEGDAHSRLASRQRRAYKRWHSSSQSLWPLLAVVLGLVVMLCFHSFIRRWGADMMPSKFPRENIGGGETPPLLFSRELDYMCKVLAPWVPQDLPSRPPPAAPETLNPVVEDELDSELQTFDSLPSISLEEVETEDGPPGGEEELAASVVQAAGGSGDDAEDKQPQSPFSGEDKIPANDDEKASIFAVPPPPSPVQTSLSATAAFPSARLPSIQRGVTPRPWKSLGKGGGSTRQPYRIHAALQKIRELLLLPELGREDLEALMTTAESLADFATKRMTDPIRVARPSAAVEDLGTRLLVLSALHDAARVVGPELPMWWHEVVDKVPVSFRFLTKAQWTGGKLYDAALAEQLRKALELYKIGGAPSDEDVRVLEQALFCSRDSRYYFRNPEWDPWRQGAAGSCGI